MGFGINYDEAGSDLLPKGEYECITGVVKRTTTQNGVPVIDFPLVIRNDVADNAYKNRKIFHSLWMKKEPTAADNACEGFSAKQIQSLSKAACLPNGKSYASIDEWCDDISNKLVRVTVDHEEYKGSMQARVKWVNETKNKECTHKWDAPLVPDGQQDFSEIIDEDDSDVPF